MKIYHNNRCSKSRQCLAFLEETKQDFEVINYLETPPSEKELKEIISMLGITPLQLVRKGEAIWKEEFKGKDLSDAAIITAMLNNPKLIERPIVVTNGKAAIARPLENVKDIL